jgi:alkyl hydroperoxide reductase subunit F
MKKDPICNMDIDENKAFTGECDGKVYYFCSEGCRDKFLKEKTCKVPRTSYDLIIIGGGPAGLTAAVYAATLKMDAFLITRELGGQAVDSTKIENYMGYDFITGPELIERHFCAQYIFCKNDNIYNRYDKEETECTWRRRVSKKGCVLRKYSGHFFCSSIAKNIHLVSNTRLTADPVIIERINKVKNLKKYEGYKILEFGGKNTLSNITIKKQAEEERTVLPIKGVFIAIGLRPNTSLVSHIVNLNERGEIIINSDCSTSYKGVFAAGDVTNAFGKRIIIASGEGAKAALVARQYILNLK